jgi:multidrug efflux pump subunit AcrB
MKKDKFGLTNLAITNRITIYFIVASLVIFGLYQYFNTPKENMPEIFYPFFNITTTYPGASPEDVENLITIPLENELKGIDGVKEIKSQSLQNISSIFVEFDTDVDEMKAYLDVREAVENAKADLPNDLPKDPDVLDIEISERPILNIHLSGDLDLSRLKEYAEELQDRIEVLKGVNRVDIVGALDREIQVNVDLYKMQAAGITLNKINEAIRSENLIISGGQLETNELKKNLRVMGKFEKPEQIGNILLKEGVYLKDIAEVVDGFADRKSYARLDGQDMVTLNVIKVGGENMIRTIEEIYKILDEFKKEASESLIITTTGDQSDRTKTMLNNMQNTMILGFFVVVLVMMFFVGIDNALFAGSVIPLSILIAIIFIPIIGFTLNNVVLIAFILVLGILVDNSVVIVENIYRHFKEKKNSIFKVTNRAVAEVAMPVLGGCLTTMAPFIPLMLWPGKMGQFFIFIPVVVLMTLTASLLVAYTINPVFAVSFMKYSFREERYVNRRRLIFISAGAILVSAVFYITGPMLVANIILFLLLIYLLKLYILEPAIKKFQNNVIPRMIVNYRRILEFVLKGKRSYWLMGAGLLLFVVTIVMFRVNPPKVVLVNFGEPDQLDVYISMPAGTHLDVTNQVSKLVEQKVRKVLGENNPDVESIIVNVGANAGMDIFDRTTQDKLAKISIIFHGYEQRVGEKSTLDYLQELRTELADIPGAEIVVEKVVAGPPVEKPINIEISGPNIARLIEISEELEAYINGLNIAGIERLETDIELGKPEVIINIDRDKAHGLGINVSMIGAALRGALYGNEVSRFREGDQDFPIRVRLSKKYRNDIDHLLNQKIEVPGRNGNPPKSVPISALVSVEEIDTYGSIIHKNNNPTVTLSSNVLEGYNANEIIASLKRALKYFEMSDGYNIAFTGEQEQQKENIAFIRVALIGALLLIFVIMVAQFNSIMKPAIIMIQIFFSFVGILFVLVLFGLDFSILLSGLGIVAVGGVVATNGIILIDFMNRKMDEIEDKKEAVISAASIRLTPVLLTTLSTIFGLLPLAIGINIDFLGLFSRLEPNIYFGGPNADFWNPLAITIISGLAFATFLTLIVEPAMYYLVYGRGQKRV